MPQFLPFASHGSEYAAQEIVDDLSPKHSRRSALSKKFAGLWKKRQELCEPEQLSLHTAPSDLPQRDEYFQVERLDQPIDAVSTLPTNGAPLRPIPSLPRPLTFRRQESEQRDKLLQVPCCSNARRTLSLDRRRGLSSNAARRSLSPKPVPLPSVSAPDIVNSDQQPFFDNADVPSNDAAKSSKNGPEQPPFQRPAPDQEIEDADLDEENDIDRASLQEEYDRRWILNLSMHFRDKSNREKFFVTYAETPNRWRRLTISLDYRNAPPDSLEADLSTLHYQRDKSFHIYEAIRDSLPEIQYYDTVTNLKLETTPEDGQLHVHVREDANEMINYPSISLFEHVQVPMVPESEVDFISHLSGFVYKVDVDEKTLIKKEIPGPDTVDEFLYEVNALDALLGCKHVTQLEGLVTDDAGETVKGLLISYASKGALGDILYDLQRSSAGLPWQQREKWAKQIVQGLSDIHEAGFVQGDFTLSNIVIDEEDNVQIIDINRRGCPVGWEPPELHRLIESGQKIGMCISVKTDLFQLGMVLWALAEECDEPERMEKPLDRIVDTAPVYFSRMVETCLSERPQGRSSAKRLLRHFPKMADELPSPTRPSVEFAVDMRMSDNSVSTHRSDKEYIDPEMAVTLADVKSDHRRQAQGPPNLTLSPISSGQVQYVNPDSNPTSSTYQVESTGSWVFAGRDGSPVGSSHRGRNSPFALTISSSATSMSGSPPSREYRRRGSDDSPTLVDPKIDFACLEPPSIEITADEKLAECVEQIEPPPSHLHSEQSSNYPSFWHTDSGFDETMDEDIHLNDQSYDQTSCNPYGTLLKEGLRHDILPPPRAQNDPDSANTPISGHDDIPTPSSNSNTPIASPNGEHNKRLGIAYDHEDIRNEIHAATNTKMMHDDASTTARQTVMRHEDDGNDHDDDNHVATEEQQDVHDARDGHGCDGFYERKGISVVG